MRAAVGRFVRYVSSQPRRTVRLTGSSGSIPSMATSAPYASAGFSEPTGGRQRPNCKSRIACTRQVAAKGNGGFRSAALAKIHRIVRLRRAYDLTFQMRRCDSVTMVLTASKLRENMPTPLCGCVPATCHSPRLLYGKSIRPNCPSRPSF
jgi:hypothetical protein